VIGPTACTPTWFAWSRARSRSRPRASGARQVLRTRERQAELVAPGRQPDHELPASHLTGHAVDLVALDGELSWQWEDT
jgi:hypothetical protein